MVSGPIQVTISGITLEGSSSDLGYQSVLSIAGANVAIANAQIVNGWRNGIVVGGNGVATILDTALSGNGKAQVMGQCDGIRASDGARLFLGQLNADGTIDTSNVVTVEGSVGNGISVLAGSSLTLDGGTVEGSGGNEIFVSGASSASISGATIQQQQAPNVAEAYAVYVYQASKLVLAQSTWIDAGTFGGAALVGSASSLVLMNAELKNNTANYATLWASGVSHLVLSGGNIIDNQAGGGTAVTLDHGSNLRRGPGRRSCAGAGRRAGGGRPGRRHHHRRRHGPDPERHRNRHGRGDAFELGRRHRGHAEFRLPHGWRHDHHGRRFAATGFERVLQQQRRRPQHRHRRRPVPLDHESRFARLSTAKVVFSPSGPQAVTIGTVSPDCLAF